MDALLLDTDVFSYLIKGTDSRAALYKPHVTGKTIALFFVTVGELFVWSVRKKWGAKRIAFLEQRLKAAVIVPYDIDLCRQFGRVKASLMEKGQVVPANDLWIGVCALRHSLPLVTHNAKDYRLIPGLNIITESERPKEPSTGSLFR